MRYYLLLVVIVALVLAGLLIHHIMRLNVIAQRKQIRTMELVGATPGFIRRPFIKTGLRMGFLAWALSIIITGVISALMFGPALALAWMISIPGILGGITLLVVSAFLSWFSTWMAVNENLGQSFNQLG